MDGGSAEQAPDDVVPASTEQQIVEGEERQDAASVPSQDPAPPTNNVMINKAAHAICIAGHGRLEQSKVHDFRGVTVSGYQPHLTNSRLVVLYTRMAASPPAEQT